MENERLVIHRWRPIADMDLFHRSLAGKLTDEEMKACTISVTQHKAECLPGTLKLHADGRIEQITVESSHPTNETVLLISEREAS